MARLLVGMHEPDTGIITIGGQKISEIELECLRKHIIYVSQIPVDISHIIGNLITVIFDYQILRKPLKILSL